MNSKSPASSTQTKPRFGQFTLRKLFVGVALICVVLGWRQMVRQYAFNELWELASRTPVWEQDFRVRHRSGEAMYRLVSTEYLNPPPCFVSRLDERKYLLAIVQVDNPVD